MNEQINLLIRDTKPKPSETKNVKLFRFFAFGTFALTLLSSLTLLLLVVLSPLGRLNEEKNGLIQQITNSNEKFVNLISLNDRLTNITGVAALRPGYDTTFELLRNQVPPEAHVQSVKMADKAITFAIESPSLEFVEKFIANIKSLNEQGNKTFRTMSLTSLTYAQGSGMYILTVALSTI